MQNIYKIKIKSEPDNTNQYPSERRYSASAVLGLGFLQIVLGILNLILTTISSTFRNEHTTDFVQFNQSLAGSFNTFVAILSSITAIVAWKKWYIDANIKWFFATSIAGTMTSIFSLCLMVYVVFEASTHLSVQILIATIVELSVSLISAHVAFNGMKNEYPEDIIASRSRGRIEVNTVYKGNFKTKPAPPPPPNILESLPRKAIKHLEYHKDSDLPKIESSTEYRERVEKFLSEKL